MDIKKKKVKKLKTQKKKNKTGQSIRKKNQNQKKGFVKKVFE